MDGYNQQRTTNGVLYVTTSHLIFVDPAGKRETWVMKYFFTKCILIQFLLGYLKDLIKKYDLILIMILLFKKFT